MVILENISKRFGVKTVLNSVNLDIRTNEIIGLIGPNGSGKTTLLNVMMGLIRPDAGTITISCKLSAGVSRKGFFGGMTVTDNLKVYAHLKRLSDSDIDKVIQLFDIDFGKTNFGKLSAGMKQRVALAQAFMGNPDLILLDEPTNHLDIDSIFKLRSAIEERKKEGTTFIIASHVLTELEKLCDRALFLFKGEIVKRIEASELGFTNLEAEYLKLSVK